MKHLIVNTLPQGDPRGEAAVSALRADLADAVAVDTAPLKILACAGCNHCWLKTPGVCSIKDDCQSLLAQYLGAEAVVFIAESKLGFVSHQMKNLIDRILPLATMYLRFEGGQMRHLPRYPKTLRMGLLYSGGGDEEFLNRWMDRAMLNFHGVSLGAYPLDRRKELCHALGDH